MNDLRADIMGDFFKRNDIDEEIEKNTRILREVFERYYYGKPYRDAFVQELRESCRSYAALNSQMERMLQERSELSEKIEKYRTQIIRLLHVYYPVELPADLRQGVRTLASDAAAFAEFYDLKATKIEITIEVPTDKQGYTVGISEIKLLAKKEG